ncbi:hypothetical protein [Ancylothrix sp. D3o]|nr:hypothetical protein [Ancylothrix sp. D3o]
MARAPGRWARVAKRAINRDAEAFRGNQARVNGSLTHPISHILGMIECR